MWADITEAGAHRSLPISLLRSVPHKISASFRVYGQYRDSQHTAHARVDAGGDNIGPFFACQAHLSGLEHCWTPFHRQTRMLEVSHVARHRTDALPADAYKLFLFFLIRQNSIMTLTVSTLTGNIQGHLTSLKTTLARRKTDPTTWHFLSVSKTSCRESLSPLQHRHPTGT